MDLVLERIYNGRWGMWIGGTAHKSEGIGGNRGFRPDENDQGVIGEVFTDAQCRDVRPRAAVLRTRLRGQVVGDLSAAVRSAVAAPWRGMRTGSTSRGWSSRATSSRGWTSFRRCRAASRATPTRSRSTPGSKSSSRCRGRRVALVLDVFNLLNTNNEVEEDEVTGPAFRDATAVQPPRSVRFGFRLAF